MKIRLEELKSPRSNIMILPCDIAGKVKKRKLSF